MAVSVETTVWVANFFTAGGAGRRRLPRRTGNHDKQVAGEAEMPRFFIDAEDIQRESGTAVLAGENFRHMRVLRIRMGETVVLCDGEGTDYSAALAAVEGDRAYFSITGAEPSTGEPAVKVTLYQALLKGSGMEHVIQKAVEVGVWRIVPVMTNRCVAKIDEMDKKKQIRYTKIALEAAKQSGRGCVPEIAAPMPFEAACREAADRTLALIAYERSVTPLHEVLQSLPKPETAAVFVGPEGGFAGDEAALAKTLGLCEVSLGRRILRAETAPTVLLSSIFYQYGEF
ncbi:16S rRNA (uracil(1498)-N(3))-methyltransferase [Oscillospiraceae bacterium OttesenSCG-928-F05]|nr:16S rRNA (uracil(1498)-N(3))-methyltransferase [Oscillospiraceae bacterium OttesenSCG-928-F05]